MSATASNQGKTTLTTALLYHFRKSVRPFKIGPDFIDPLFHQKICQTPSINLDTCIMNEAQVKWLFDKYSDKNISILEGVMGFYDGMDKNASAYDVTKLLNVPTIIVLDASGSYITLSAIIKGLKTYQEGNTIKGVIFNHVGSNSHFELIKNQVEKDFDDIEVLGWIENRLDTLDSTHLGLDLKDNEFEKLEHISKEVLKHIDLEKLEKIAEFTASKTEDYPFEKIEKYNKHITLVNDENFSFLYHDNLEFLKESFEKVTIVNAINNEIIPSDADIVFIVGGYIETSKAYEKIENSNDFKNSLLTHAKQNKAIYGECAGLLFLSNRVDDKKMMGLLDLDFTLGKKFYRMGYYENELGITGHAFHFTKLIDEQKVGEYKLYKKNSSDGTYAAFKNNNVFGTYLHTMFRNNFNKIKKYLNL
ncbi:cobyrinate a,c-diamide synthase [Arcobacter ellisii]|uniref:cobyrinate a,c-diamide synthase n=1 Tax=Arcobacter ellisii TaxID=913109 RepID=UPI001D00D15C|nr:cobyrinate a,c-diamide synthase [Arcobacter ellisii]